MGLRTPRLRFKSGRARLFMYYETLSSGYEALHREEQLHKLRLIRENIQLHGDERILDVGCGPCWSRELFPHVIGIDPVHYNEHVIQASAESIPFPAQSFDIILCVTTIHHFELDKALAEMKRVAKNDALFVITVLKKASLFHRIVEQLQQEFGTLLETDGTQDNILFLVSKQHQTNHPLVSTKL